MLDRMIVSPLGVCSTMPIPSLLADPSSPSASSDLVGVGSGGDFRVMGESESDCRRGRRVPFWHGPENSERKCCDIQQDHELDKSDGHRRPKPLAIAWLD